MSKLLMLLFVFLLPAKLAICFFFSLRDQKNFLGLSIIASRNVNNVETLTNEFVLIFFFPTSYSRNKSFHRMTSKFERKSILIFQSGLSSESRNRTLFCELVSYLFAIKRRCQSFLIHFIIHYSSICFFRFINCVF